MGNMISENHIDVTVSDEPECRKILAIEIAPERFRDERERVLRSMLKKVALPGFRKGKVPENIVRRQFSEEIRAEALKSILPLAYGHAVNAEKLQPIGEPVFSDISAIGDRPLTFRVEIEVAPVITLDEYRGIAVDEEDVIIDDDEINKILADFQEREADYVTVDRPAVTSDVVLLDYAPVKKDGTVNTKKRVSDYPVQLGSGHLIPAFEKAVIGTIAGATARATIDYPNDFEPARLAGKTVTYEFTLKEVKEKRLPPLDDEFAAKVEKSCATIGELRDWIAGQLRTEKEKEVRRKREEAAIDILIERNPFEVPRSMLEKFKNELNADNERRRKALGVEPEWDAAKKKEIDETIEKIALRSIKRYFLMEHIAEKEKLEIGDEDVRRELERIAEESGKRIEEVEKVFSPRSDHLGKLKDNLRQQKVFEIILGGARRT